MPDPRWLDRHAVAAAMIEYNTPCACYGQPTHVIWQDERKVKQIGHGCDKCGHSWPVRPER